MTRNMGVADRTLRVLVALIVAGLIWKGVLTGTLAIVLGIFAGIFVLTSLISFCPLYLPFGLSTLRRRSG